MCEYGTVHVLHRSVWPEWLQAYRNGDRLPIDACIVDTVRALWNLDVITLGSCCGHGKERPELVLEGDKPQAEHARWAIAAVDPDRSWRLFQWRLCDVTTNPVVAIPHVETT